MASGFITVTVRDEDTQTALQQKLETLCSDEKTKYGITKILIDRITKYVPKKSGKLRASVRNNTDTVSWRTPYAHYQYMGWVYGPNFRILTKGGIPEWRSPRKERGIKKWPTGKPLGWYGGYTTAGTGPDWVNEMWANERRAANVQITNYLKRRAKELRL